MKGKKVVAGFISLVMMMQASAFVTFADSGISRSYVYDDFTVEYEVTNSYEDIEVVDIILTNTGDETIENWMLYFEPNGDIEYVIDAEKVTAPDGSIYFKNMGYNANIEVGAEKKITYAIKNCTEVPEYFAFCQSRVEKTDGYTVSLSMGDTWEDSFNGSIVITNNTDEPIEAWELTIDTNFTIKEFTKSWAANVTELGNDQYRLKGTYTSTIAANSSVPIGFIGVRNGDPTIDSYSMTEIKPTLYDNGNNYIELTTSAKKLSNAEEGSVAFYAESNLKVDEIKLWSENSNSIIGVMKDDGDFLNNGDKYMNDGVYTCVIDVDNSSVGNLSFYASYINIKSNDVDIPIYRLFTQQELDDMNVVDEAIQTLVNDDTFSALSESEKTNAINNLLISLTENNNSLGYTLIQENSINYSADWKVFEFKYACGVFGAISLSDDEDVDNVANVQTEFEMQEQLVSSVNGGIYGTALLMNGFERRAFRDNYYNGLKAELDGIGLATDLVMDVTITDLENMDNHDFIGICMHGSYPSNGHIVLCTQETVTAEKDNLYAYELQLGIVRRAGNYWYTEELFEEFYDENSFEGSIIYLQNCCSLGIGGSIDDANYAMANTLINCGADTVVGNLNSIKSVYNQNMMKMFIIELLNGSTTYTALANCKNAYGYDDGDGDGIIELEGSEYEAVPCLVGSATKYLVNQNILNGSFESKLDEWQYYGDVSTKICLGSEITPENGQRMAFITTKTNECSNSGIYQTFTIPSYASTLTFTYDVISEEPLEWIDEGYNDAFTAKLMSTTSENTIAFESTDTSNWIRVTDVNLPYGDNTTYHTGAITVKYDVTALRESTVKLVFDVQDSGDNTYDTAVVIDNVSFIK